MIYLDTEITAFLWQFTKENEMGLALKIIKHPNGWYWNVYNNKDVYTISNKFFKTTEEALEAGSKKLLELLHKETFDFGQGPVPAHQHPNGGGWIANTARVAKSVYVGPNARVFEFAQVCWDAHIDGYAQVYGHAEVYGYAHIYGSARVHGDTRIFEFAQIYGHADVVSGIICGHQHINASNEKYVLIGSKCIGPFNSPGEASEAMVPGLTYKIKRLVKP